MKKENKLKIKHISGTDAKFYIDGKFMNKQKESWKKEEKELEKLWDKQDHYVFKFGKSGFSFSKVEAKKGRQKNN